jgi:hypothetical protein
MKKQKIVLILGVILTFLLIGYGAYMLFWNSEEKSDDLSVPTQVSTVSRDEPTQTPISTLPSPISTGSVPEGWEKYFSQEMGFSVRFPSEMEVRDDQEGYISFVVLGPSQAEGTEVYDGIILSFSQDTYSSSSLESFVISEVNRKRDELIYDRVSDVEPVVVNGIQGYKYSESALGDFTNIYLSLNGGSYLLISYLLEDPTSQGYEEDLNMILSSLTLNYDN